MSVGLKSPLTPTPSGRAKEVQKLLDHTTHRPYSQSRDAIVSLCLSFWQISLKKLLAF